MSYIYIFIKHRNLFMLLVQGVQVWVQDPGCPSRGPCPWMQSLLVGLEEADAPCLSSRKTWWAAQTAIQETWVCGYVFMELRIYLLRTFPLTLSLPLSFLFFWVFFVCVHQFLPLTVSQFKWIILRTKTGLNCSVHTDTDTDTRMWCLCVARTNE